MTQIRAHGASWCPDCKRSKRFLAEHRVAHEWIDTDEDPEGVRYSEARQHGGRTIPTIVFPDQSYLLVPHGSGRGHSPCGPAEPRTTGPCRYRPAH